MVTGAAAALASYIFTQLKYKFKYDDSMDAFAIHGIGGATGAIFTAIFSSMHEKRLPYELAAIGVVTAWSVVGTFIIVSFLYFVGFDLRVTKTEEEEGLDLALHKQQIYDSVRVSAGLPHSNDIAVTVFDGCPTLIDAVCCRDPQRR